jgi:hypothetical protein
MSKAASESDFSPDILGLQEELSLLRFQAEYKNTDSEEYYSVIREIDNRIGGLPLFSTYH